MHSPCSTIQGTHLGQAELADLIDQLACCNLKCSVKLIHCTASQSHPLLQDEDLALAKVLQEQEQMFLRLRRVHQLATCCCWEAQHVVGLTHVCLLAGAVCNEVKLLLMEPHLVKMPYPQAALTAYQRPWSTDFRRCRATQHLVALHQTLMLQLHLVRAATMMQTWNLPGDCRKKKTGFTISACFRWQALVSQSHTWGSRHAYHVILSCPEPSSAHESLCLRAVLSAAKGNRATTAWLCLYLHKACACNFHPACCTLSSRSA